MRRNRVCVEIFGDSLDALEQRLRELPSGFTRCNVRIAVASPSASAKRLEGLPSVRDRTVLRAIVRENASAFFMLREPFVCDVSVERDGIVRAAAIDGSVMREITSTVARHGCVLELVIPSAAIPEDATLETLRPDAPFAFRPGRGRRRGVMRRLVRAAAAIVLALAASAAVFAPAARARHDARNAHAVPGLDKGPPPALERELRSVSQLLDVHARFMAQRGGTARVFLELARVLPDSVALTSVRIDSLDVVFVATGPQLATLLPELGAIPLTMYPRVTSQVTRESFAGVKLERASFRLRRVRPRKS